MTNHSLELTVSNLAADLLQAMRDETLGLSAEQIAHDAGQAVGIWMMSACASGANMGFLSKAFSQAMLAGGQSLTSTLTESIIKSRGGRN